MSSCNFFSYIIHCISLWVFDTTPCYQWRQPHINIRAITQIVCSLMIFILCSVARFFSLFRFSFPFNNKLLGRCWCRFFVISIFFILVSNISNKTCCYWLLRVPKCTLQFSHKLIKCWNTEGTNERTTTTPQQINVQRFESQTRKKAKRTKKIWKKSTQNKIV